MPGVHSVLVLGSSSALAQTLEVAGLEAEGCQWEAAALPGESRRYDIAVCLSAPNLSPEDCSAIASAVAQRSGRVLFSPECAAACGPWLRAFLAAGYRPDLALDPEWAGAGAVWLQAGGADPDQADILAELLRLRSESALRNASAGELERAVQDLRKFASEVREREERADLRLAHLYARTNQITHTVKSILDSRIWRTLVTAGGWLLRAGEFGGRLRGRGTPARGNPAKTDVDNLIRVHCDEPNAQALDRLLRNGMSGELRIRGWAVSESGISRVELEAGGQPAVEARIGLYRPELEMLYPTFSNADRGGFAGKIDTLSLPNGLHTLKIRAWDSRGGVKELEVPLRVDHVHGYAHDYHRWIQDFEKRDPAQIELSLRTFAHRPRVSILAPAYRTHGAILEKTIGSVRNQSYPDWELCVADDCSQSPEMDAILDRHAASDGRVKVVHLPENRGIAGATNAALAMATGEFVALLDHDDELAQDALFHVVETLNRRPGADIFYSDEDHIDDEGLRSDPFFKPDWSPDLILGENYVCHFLVLRTGLCRDLGGFRSETDLSQDLDMVLRASLRTQRIVHIPRVLYHWRTEVYTGDRASDSHVQRVLESSRRGVADYLKATDCPAKVVRGAVSLRWRVRYPVPSRQAVRILVPSANLTLLKRCLQGLAEKTDFRAFEVSVIDNSRGAAIAGFVAGWREGGCKATYVDCRNQPFNFSTLNNYGARNVREPLLLFLNDDVSMIHGDWLEAMVELASRPEVGAVGAKLLYPDNTIQHAGVVLGIFGIAGHAFRGSFAEKRTYFDFPDLIRNVSAVTGACMMVPTDKFRACGGFDEEAFPVAYNDIDLCLRLGQKGYRILYTPHAQLYHHEAASKRGADRDPRAAEAELFKARWKGVIEHDPFYSPNLTVDAEDYSYRRPAEWTMPDSV